MYLKGETIIIGNITKFLELFLHEDWWCVILLGIGDFMFGSTVAAMNIFLCSFGTGSCCHSSLLINGFSVIIRIFEMDVESRGSITRLSRLCGKTGNRCFDWSSLNRWIKFSGLLTALQTLDLVLSNQLQRRDTYLENTTRCFSEGMQVDDQVGTRAEVEFYLVFSTILLSGVKSILAMLVVFLDRENSFRDGKKVIRIIGSEMWLLNGYKCNDFGYKWNDLYIFIAPLFVYWSNIVGADHGFEFLRCDELQGFLFVPISLTLGFVMVSRVRMIKYRISFPFQKTKLLWLCNGIITANVIYVVLSMDKDNIYG